MPKSPNPAITNIETAARIEQEFLETRTTSERLADAIGTFVGTLNFVLVHILWFIIWAVVNAKMIPFIPAFDPYPFPLLTMAVSLEGVLLTTFVLMKQNRMSRRADHRDQLNLQVDLLAEKEVTKMLQMLRTICDHMGLNAQASEPEVQALSETTAVDMLARELRKKMPE
jgi:uncharacterized membrane protein